MLNAHLHIAPSFKNSWRNTSTLLYIFMVWYLVKAHGNFTLPDLLRKWPRNLKLGYYLEHRGGIEPLSAGW